MKQHLCRVLENRLLWSDVQLLTLDAPELARAMRPGQFALARDPTTLDPYLRRALWLYEIRDERVSFVINVSDPLARRARAGDTLDLLAPLGRAVEFEPSARHILLMGEGTRITRLVAIAHEAVKLGREVVLVSPSLVADGGGRESSPTLGNSVPTERSQGEDSRKGVGVEIFPAHLLASEIEYRTEETLSAELIAWADALIANGSRELYRAITDMIRAARYRVEPGFARAFVEIPMPCGIGVCYACAVETSRGVKLVCVDGPTLDLVEFEKRRM